jgi:hypothetical protein
MCALNQNIKIKMFIKHLKVKIINFKGLGVSETRPMICTFILEIYFN